MANEKSAVLVAKNSTVKTSAVKIPVAKTPAAKTKIIWDVCGHELIKQFLISSINSGRLFHAFLLVGKSHLGKYHLAQELAQTVLCQNETVKPCRKCANCQIIAKESHPDVFLVKRLTDEKTGRPKKDISIEQIRELRAQLQKSSLFSGYKIAIIAKAQLINLNGANSLLKILEEPTPKTIIILIADDLRRLPKTVISRCQVLRFLPVPQPTIEEYLLAKGSSPSQAKKISLLSFNRPGRARQLMAEPELLNEEAKENIFFWRALLTDSGERLKLIDDWFGRGKDDNLNNFKINRLLDNWQALIRDLFLFKNDNSAYLAQADNLPSLTEAANHFDFKRLTQAVKLIRQAKDYLRQNVNAKLVLENLIINL